MADDADMRAVLREHGHEPSSRGRLSPRWVTEYEKITNGQAPADNDSGESWDGPDDEADIITGIIPDDIGGISDDAEPAPVPPERRPRRVKAKPSGSITDRLLGRKPGAKPKPRRKITARLPADRLISRLWEYAGRIVAPVSPHAARAFILEAGVAGMMFDDMVRDTFIDPALQKAVRAEAAAEQVVALTPPLIVLAIDRAQGMEEPRRSVQLAVLFAMLEEALTLQVRFAGSRMAEIQARMVASEAEREQVRAIMAQIFADPPGAVQAEQNGQQAGAPEFSFSPSET